MNSIKYSLVFILFAISGFYTGLFLYHYRQKDVKTETKVTDKIRTKGLPINQIPEHLTKEFWTRITPEQLEKKLQNIENINEVRSDNKKSMLHFLAIHGKYPEMISLLIDKGANYKSEDIEMVKALHYAVIRKEKALEFTKELLKYEANVDEHGGRSRATPLLWATYFRASIELIKFLLEQGADPHFRTNTTGNHALLTASAPNNQLGTHFIDPQVIQLLLKYKIDIKIKNSKGKTAYDFMKENKEFRKTDIFKKISRQF